MIACKSQTKLIQGKENKKLNNSPVMTKVSGRHAYETDENHYLLFQHEPNDIKEIV